MMHLEMCAFPQLSDFGLSRIEDNPDELAPPTFPFNSCGTAAYVAPEALVSQKKVGASLVQCPLQPRV